MRHLFPLLPLLITGCTVEHPISKTAATNNHSYKVEYLFEHEGCKVYRFHDNGNYVYFTNCNGEAIARTDSTAVTNTTRLMTQKK
ncbi:MAG: DUF4884 domain-containing protein [Bacteroidetes bacterium]|nr:DUF4884 domain-containing protein [Bacteroidota bacterium]